MKTGTVVLGALALAGAAGLAGYSVAPSHSEETCLYAAVSTYPALPADKPALDHTAACAGLSGPQKAHLREMVSRFITSAAVKAAKEG